MAQSLRFFYSINSFKSRGNSFDESLTTCKNGSIDSQNSSPVMVRSVNTANGVATEGLFGMRNGRLHTYCSPRSSNGLSNGSIKDYPAVSQASKILNVLQQPQTQIVSRTKVPRGFLNGLFRSTDRADSSLERFV
jgi:hypothetical protein